MTLGYQTGPISCKKQGIMYIKSYFIIDSDSFKYNMGTLVTTCNNFISGWEFLGWQDKAEKSLQKSVIFYQLALKAKKIQTKLQAEMLY